MANYVTMVIEAGLAPELTPIPGFDGYAVTRGGRVMSYKWGKRRWLKPSLKQAGERYLRYHLYANGKSIRGFSAHRAVALAYIPNPKNLPIVNHIDGDPANNYVGNLEWCDNQHNMRHASRVLGRQIGDRHWAAKLTDGQVADIFINRAESNRVMAERHSTTTKYVASIRRGEARPFTTKHLTPII